MTQSLRVRAVAWWLAKPAREPKKRAAKSHAIEVMNSEWREGVKSDDVVLKKRSAMGRAAGKSGSTWRATASKARRMREKECQMMKVL